MDVMIPEFIRQMKLSSGLNTQRVFRAWDSVSGASAYTIRRFYRDGKLYITLSSSMLRSHLEFRREELVVAVNSCLEKDELFVKDHEKAGYVKEIIFK